MGGAEYLETCGAAKIFVQSTHDEFGPRAALEELFAATAQPKRLVWVEAADHFFAGALETLEETVWREVREYAML
jgi:alpha/beta superfamily hydrolase